MNLTDGIPVVTQSSVIPHSKKQQIYDQIQPMLNDEIIQPSDSSYSSAVVLDSVFAPKMLLFT